MRQKLLMVLYGKASNILMVAFAMGIVGATCYERDGPLSIQALSLVGLALLCTRAVMVTRFNGRRHQAGLVDVDLWLVAFAFLGMASSVCSGMLAFVCLASSHDPVLYVLSLVVTVATAGAIAARNGSFPRVAITQIVVSLAPPMVGCLLADDRAYAILALLIPCLLVGLSIIVRDANKQLVELFETQRRLSDLTYTDGLTGVHNRRFFDRSINQRMTIMGRSQLPIGALMIDVDFFKAFNDHYGHLEGDRCLQQVATILRKQMRSSSDVLCRYGGEEFAVIIDDADTAAVTGVAQRMCDAVTAARLCHQGRNDGIDVVTISIGAAVTSDRAALPLALIATADRALYDAKRLGRNRFCVA